MTYNNTQRLGGICALLEALVYIAAFIVYGAILVYPGANAGITEKLGFLNDNYLTLSVLNFTSYVFFGIVLAGLVLSLYERMKDHSPFYSKLTTVFGVIWVGLVIASGMIANIGMNSVIKIGVEEPERAMAIWSSITIVAEALGGGNEIVGGIWVLMLSVITLKGELFSKPLSYLGIIVGLTGILTLYPSDIFKDIFGLTQIVWFTWIGVTMLRQN